jgi:hypothetical protein
LLVYAVDDNGEQTPFNGTTDVWLDHFAEGTILVLKMTTMTQINVRFNWGVMENGVWTPNPLPWLLLTFMDLDAGNPRKAMETITTSDAARYTAGEDVTVTQEDGTIKFACYVKGNVPNPTNGILTEEQHRVAASLEFENKEHFTITVENVATALYRRVFFTGITTLNWPELAPPAPTPPTPAPTPVPTAAAVGDPHVNSITGLKFDLWRTGWSTFVQIPQSEEKSAKLLVRGDVRRYGRDPCAPSFLYQVHVNGSWLGGHAVIVRAGSLESSDPMSVTLDEGEPLHLRGDAETVFINESHLRLRGDIVPASDEWGADGRIRINVGSTELSIVQHTEGRGEGGNAMLDLSVTGLDDLVEPVGGWLGVDGPQLAGEMPIECVENGF